MLLCHTVLNSTIPMEKHRLRVFLSSLKKPINISLSLIGMGTITEKNFLIIQMTYDNLYVFLPHVIIMTLIDFSLLVHFVSSLYLSIFTTKIIAIGLGLDFLETLDVLKWLLSISSSSFQSLASILLVSFESIRNLLLKW